MSEFDPLRKVLREWAAPEPSAALDARVRAGFRAARAPSLWRRLWTARVSVPVPVLAAVLLVLAMAWLVEFRPAVPQAPVTRAPGVVTRLEATGFQPLPDGVARVIPVEEAKQ
jgi:hypothetical protein